MILQDTYEVKKADMIPVEVSVPGSKEGVYLYRYRDAEDGDIVVEQITEPAEYKRVSRAYEAR